jgi:ankyrin repeat protein
MSLTVAGLALMIGMQLQGKNQGHGGITEDLGTTETAIDRTVSPASVDNLSDSTETTISLSEIGGEQPALPAPSVPENIPALPGTAAITPPPVEAVPESPHRSTITITESKESPALPPVEVADAGKKDAGIKPTLPTITVEETPHTPPKADSGSTLSFSGDPEKDVAEGDTEDEVTAKSETAPLTPPTLASQAVPTPPKPDASNAASLDFSVLDLPEDKDTKKPEEPKKSQEEPKKAEAAPKVEPKKETKTAETTPPKETKKPKEVKETAKKKSEEDKKALAALEDGTLPKDDGRAQPTTELMEELDLEVPEIKRLVRNLNDEADEGEAATLEASRRQDPLLYRYPTEPYERSQERPTFSYRNQVLSEKVYKREYSYQNRHLPRRVIQSDYDQKFFGAAMDDNMTALRALSPRITSVDMQDNNGATPLIFAVRYGRMDAVRYLLANGADPNLPDNHGFTPLHHAFFADRPDIIHALRTNGANVSIADAQGMTPFDYAINRRQYQVASMLRGAQQDVNAEDANGDTPLQRAVRSRDVKQAAFLLKQGADANRYDRQGYTPLMHAAFNGDNMMLNTLIQFGADPTIRDPYGRKAADIAELGGFSQVANYLGSVEATHELFKGQEQAHYIGATAPVIDPNADRIRVRVEPKPEELKKPESEQSSTEEAKDKQAMIIERTVRSYKASYTVFSSANTDPLPIHDADEAVAAEDDKVPAVEPAVPVNPAEQPEKVTEEKAPETEKPQEQAPEATPSAPEATTPEASPEATTPEKAEPEASKDAPQPPVAPEAEKAKPEDDTSTLSPKQQRREEERQAQQKLQQQQETARQAQRAAQQQRKTTVTPLRDIKRLPGIPKVQ